MNKRLPAKQDGDPVAKLRAICLAPPDAAERETFGGPSGATCSA